jgi:cell division protein FtsN
MAQVKKKSSGGGKKKNRGWLLLLIGLGIGLAAAYLGQLVMEHNFHRTVASWFKRDKPVETGKTTKAEKPKSKFDFYTILPETETVVPDRDSKRPPKTTATKAEKPEEGIAYILQAGSFKKLEEADQRKAELALQGLEAYIQKVSIEGKGEYHRVLLGPYDKLDDLDATTQQLNKMGIKTLRLKGKKGAG